MCKSYVYILIYLYTYIVILYDYMLAFVASFTIIHLNMSIFIALLIYNSAFVFMFTINDLYNTFRSNIYVILAPIHHTLVYLRQFNGGVSVTVVAIDRSCNRGMIMIQNIIHLLSPGFLRPYNAE